MKHIFTIIMFLTLGFLNINAQEEEVGTCLSNIQVIDEVRYLLVRSRYNDPAMNTTEWQWNAALSTRFGKKKLWTARLVGFDLLHQLSNIKYTLDSHGRVETWHNTVRSYVNLNLTYHFEMKPKKGISQAK